MNRIRYRRDAESIAATMDLLPIGVRLILGNVPFVSEYEPRFLGLHFYDDTSDGRSYSNTSHVCWPVHQSHRPAADRESVIVLLAGDAHAPLVVLHELGHVLDERLEFPSTRLQMKPLDPYAATSSVEAFATAFQSWCVTMRPIDHPFYHDNLTLTLTDPAMAAFFDRLA